MKSDYRAELFCCSRRLELVQNWFILLKISFCLRHKLDGFRPDRPDLQNLRLPVRAQPRRPWRPQSDRYWAERSCSPMWSPWTLGFSGSVYLGRVGPTSWVRVWLLFRLTRNQNHPLQDNVWRKLETLVAPRCHTKNVFGFYFPYLNYLSNLGLRGHTGPSSRFIWPQR